MKLKINHSDKIMKLAYAVFLFLISLYGNAQLKGGHILGSSGLQSGTQAPEKTLSLYVPGYIYTANCLRDGDGDKTGNPDLNMFLTGIGANYVSDFKILGANYGATVLVAFASNTIQGSFIDSKSNFAFTDMLVQPVQLGWHNKRADFVFSYQMYLPTGTYEYGGSNNSGLGMFMNEFSAGTTLFFNDKKTFHFSALAAYEINGKKKDTDIKTGDILSLEGGLGKTFYCMNAEKTAPKGILNAGLIYYFQFKVSDDKIPVGTFLLEPDKDHVSALGAEVNYLHLGCMTQAGFRWVSELGAVNRFQGNTFFITLAHVFSFKKK
ncbi:Protein involved in meta-pathway of phenol degradation-like protein [Flavobacterium anhuiense]|uniref:Protein involved in meta-pathway of phenol degradation-like protein n=1 Tax=Flavobacterium anhuiense TaxID=459526 RepID=A0A444W287_9FLAO|nr:transporter [Flavobacterium anhuiense]RYJ39997.1 Protein involved in meta-pathway of phenol degradation-like protein [Flavobacterium anhuiense]